MIKQSSRYSYDNDDFVGCWFSKREISPHAHAMYINVYKFTNLSNKLIIFVSFASKIFNSNVFQLIHFSVLLYSNLFDVHIQISVKAGRTRSWVMLTCWDVFQTLRLHFAFIKLYILSFSVVCFNFIHLAAENFN